MFELATCSYDPIQRQELMTGFVARERDSQCQQ